MILIKYDSSSYPKKFDVEMIKTSYRPSSDVYSYEYSNYLKIPDELIYEYWLVDVIEISKEDLEFDDLNIKIHGKYRLKINEEKYRHLQTILKIKDNLTNKKESGRKKIKIMDILDKALYDLSEGYYEKN
jgi:hypothetical protein